MPCQSVVAPVTLLVTRFVIAMSATTGRSPEMLREERIALQRLELRVGDFDRDRAGQIAAEEAVQAPANGAKRARVRRCTMTRCLCPPGRASRGRRKPSELGLTRGGRDPGTENQSKGDRERNEAFHRYCSVLNQPHHT